MKKVMMTSFYDKEKGIRGDCLRACLASLLEVDIFEFEHHTWIGDYIEKLNRFGVEYIDCVANMDYSKGSRGVDGLFIAYGKSSRGVLHAIIINENGELVHDPHPSNEGVSEISGIFIIEKTI